MINPRELRIGNLVDHGGHEYVVEEIKDETLEIEMGNLYFEAFFPVPLTEEWLLKFGAEQLNKHKLMIGNEFFSSNSKGEIFWERDYDRDEPIQYVHQLQNLYFALTGEELTLNSQPIKK